MAWNELYEQPNLRAGGPLESKHIKVLNGMVEVPDEVKNVDKMAHEDLPSKPCNRSTTNDLPSVQELLLEGEQALCTSPRNPHGIEDELTSGTTNSQSSYTEEPRLTVYDPGSTLGQPMAHNWAAENKGRLSSPARHEDEASSCMKQHIPNAHRVLLEGENTRCMSSDKRNLQEHMNTSGVLGMCTHSPSGQEEPTASSTESAGLDNNTEMPRNAWQNVSTGQTKDVNVPTPQNMPIEVPSFKNQDITFGRLVSPNEGHMASGVEGDITGGDGKPRDGEDSMTGSGDVNLEQVKGALLAEENQDEHQSQNSQGNLPVSSWPPTRLQKCSYEAVRPRCQQGRIKFEAGNVSRKQRGKKVCQSCNNTILHA
ncbi:hypothetical protein EDD16DRAFT_1521053 [Pisolithus croceorrhizus]|nr:hypothetical protein EDD16DRAFT_1521053 [Pisolithus croceorrhizus]